MLVKRVAVLTGLILMLAAAACGSVRPQAATLSHQLTIAEPGQPVPASAVRRLTVIADQAVAANGGHGVTWATVVVTTHAKALTWATPGDFVPSGAKTVVYLVTIHGHFVCGLCSGPAGSRAPTGSYLSLVITARTFEGTDFGLSDRPPPVAPGSLGPVTYLKVRQPHG